MHLSDRDAAGLWRQAETKIPVVYRRSGGQPLLIRFRYWPDNRDWLRSQHRRKPQWNTQFKCWQTPKSWFEEVVRRLLKRFERVYVIQPFRPQEKCAPACWNAIGIECECSCMGEYHGSGDPPGKWHIVSETFAVQWHDRRLACRLIGNLPGV